MSTTWDYLLETIFDEGVRFGWLSWLNRPVYILDLQD